MKSSKPQGRRQSAMKSAAVMPANQKSKLGDQECPKQLTTTQRPPSTILLAVTGMSPAVLTETVWALAKEDPPVIPDRVAVVTTICGRQAIERELLTRLNPETPAIWHQLRLAVLGVDAEKQERVILEPPRLVESPNPRTGQTDWLEDLRTPAENHATANFLLSELRRWTEIPDMRLIVSIAGGRKTMGALLYACVSLLGRETDRMTHVLVNDPFEDPRLTPRFYFPPQAQQHLKGVDGRQYQAADARIDLADIPFVPFRNLFERELVKKPGSFTELVQRCSVKVEELARRNVRLEMRHSRRSAHINGTEVKLSSLQCLLLLFLAQNAKLSRPVMDKYANAIEPLSSFANQLRSQCMPEDGNDWRDQAILPASFDDQGLRKVLDELKAKLRKAGSDAAALIPVLPVKGRFSLDLPAAAITFKD